MSFPQSEEKEDERPKNSGAVFLQLEKQENNPVFAKRNFGLESYSTPLSFLKIINCNREPSDRGIGQSSSDTGKPLCSLGLWSEYLSSRVDIEIK